jgi:predicted DNA repair protein MutK
MRRRRRLALLVLPALLLRALIPAGFMPIGGAGGTYLGFCPGAGALPAANELATHASHSGHTHHSGGAPGAPGTQHNPSCLFSTGATTTFAATLAAALAPPVLSAPAARVASLIFLPAILRSQSSRAPPSLSES